MIDPNTDIAAALDAGKKLSAKIIDITDVNNNIVGKVLVKENDQAHIDLQDMLPAPRRVVQQVHAKTAKGFVDYVNTFGDKAKSVGFLNPIEKSFGVIVDYHASQPGWCQHRVGFKPAHSAAFTAWAGICGRALKQTDLADFIEDHIGEIAQPASAVLLELVQKFAVTSEVAFSSAMNQANGTVQFAYTENVKGGNALSAPTELTIVTPVFDGEAPQNIKIKFRFKVTDGKLSITLLMVRLDEILRIALEKIADRITKDTDPSVRVWIEGATA